jgi:phosphate transport system substrate-binding protein
VSVATEDYVLSRRLFLYTKPNMEQPFLREFVDFTQSDMGQAQVGRTGFISQALIAIAPAIGRDGPSEYLALTRNAGRLSVNFRFSEGSASLDNKAQRDIQRVADYMERAENIGKTLTLIGFGDVKQSTSRSTVLSKLRAITVRSALRKVGVNTAPVNGYGAYLPVASNTQQGKVKNRRVEIWVR